MKQATLYRQIITGINGKISIEKWIALWASVTLFTISVASISVSHFRIGTEKTLFSTQKVEVNETLVLGVMTILAGLISACCGIHANKVNTITKITGLAPNLETTTPPPTI